MSVAEQDPQFSRGRRLVASFSIGVLSFLFSWFGTSLTATLAEEFDWCCVHGWALLHGSGIIVLMAWGLLGFHLVAALAARLRLAPSSGRFGALPHVAYISSALGSFSFSLTNYFMWLGLISSIAAVIARWRGRPVKPFGLVMVSLLVSLLCVAQWAWLRWLSYSARG